MHRQHDPVHQLEKMANDIGDFFAGEPNREDAIKGISNHLRSFWTDGMRQKLLAEVERGGEGLHELPKMALIELMKTPTRPPEQTPGGDAG